MSSATAVRPTLVPTHQELADPAYQGFLLLRIAFTVAPILFGLDKFAHVLVDWDKYLAPEFADVLPWTTHQLMYAVGVVEIVAGIVVALRPRFGGYLVAAWLGGIIVNLLMQADFYDIALRDFGLLLGALTLARLATAYRVVTTAFVLSGGGSLGAVQVGMLQALAADGLQPDLLVGTSAGAVNAAWVAGHGMGADSLDRLASVWTGLRRRDVFPISPLRSLLSMAGVRGSLCPSGPLRSLLETHLPYGRLEDAAIPVHVVATDALAGTEVLLSEGDALDAVMASAAIPGIFDPVCVDGRLLCDGGVANNAAVSQAIALGADRVMVLPAGTACALDRPPRSPLGAALHAITLLIDGRLALEILHYADTVDLAVVPHLCPLSVHAADFRHADELIDRARTSTGAWLARRELGVA